MRKSLHLFLCLFVAFTVHAQNKLEATGNAGIGTTSPVSMLEMRKYTLNRAEAPFITLHNRGSDGTYTDRHVIGGVLGAAYRDVRDPANVAGIWFERVAAVSGLSSQGDIVFGATTEPLTLSEKLPEERMRINSVGHVGIGTAAPLSPLDVNGETRSKLITLNWNNHITGYMGEGAVITGGWSAVPEAMTITLSGRDFALGGWRKSDGLWMGASLFIDGEYGNVLIGKINQANTSHKLDVNGSVHANKVVVNSSGADFVFDSSYVLPSLQQVEQHIKTHRHLPGIAPAAEMERNGMDVGEQQTKLLQKLEEMTLYIIEMNKKLEVQQQLIAEQAKALRRLTGNAAPSASPE